MQTRDAQFFALQAPEVVGGILQQLTRNASNELYGEKGSGEITLPRIARDVPSLKACSLVSKIWHREAVRYLFRLFKAEFGRLPKQENGRGPNHGHTAPLIQFLKSSPLLREAVRELHLDTSAKFSQTDNVCRNTLFQLISMFPHLQALKLSGALEKTLGSAESKPVQRKKFPRTLQRLTLVGEQNEFRGGGSYTFSFGVRCYLHGLLNLLVQLGTIKELDLLWVGLDFEGDRDTEARNDTQDEALSKLRRLGLSRSCISTRVVSRLWTSHLTYLDLMPVRDFNTVHEALQNVSADICAKLPHLCLWVPEDIPTNMNSLSFDLQRLTNLRHLSINIFSAIPTPWHNAERILQSLLSNKPSLDVLELKVVVHLGPRDIYFNQEAVQQHVSKSKFETALIRAAEQKEFPLVRVGLFASSSPHECVVHPIPGQDALRYIFPRFAKLGYLSAD